MTVKEVGEYNCTQIKILQLKLLKKIRNQTHIETTRTKKTSFGITLKLAKTLIYIYNLTFVQLQKTF